MSTSFLINYLKRTAKIRAGSLASSKDQEHSASLDLLASLLSMINWYLDLKYPTSGKLAAASSHGKAKGK